jgi:hypothetical protein
MNHRHRKLLHALFSHPMPSNLDRREVEGLMTELGADLDHTHHGRLMIKHEGHSVSMHASEHDLSKDDVHHLKKFIELCGVDPARDFPV